MTTLTVTVERVAYPPSTSEPDAWYILITSGGVCKGEVAWRPNDKDSLTLEGDWGVHKGERQFFFKAARLNLPVSARDQLHYACIRTKGLGSAAEEAIWSAFGEKWQEIPENGVARLSGRVYQQFKLQMESLRDLQTDAATIAVLLGKGLTQNMAQSAVKAWGKDCLGIIQSDPYRLAELKNYSFKDVDDKIRKAYGIGDSDDRRIKSGVVYALRRLTDGGDTFVLWSDLFQKATGLLQGYADEISEITVKLFEDGTLKGFSDSEGVALKEHFRAENDIWDFVNKQETESE